VKQVVQNLKTGVVSVEDVPVPQLRHGCVLVRNRASLISSGTEGGTVKLGKMSLLGKARARPEQVKKVIKSLRTEGFLATVNAVNRTLDLPIPLGYSCAGVVEASSDEITDLPVGTPVACGGAGMAYHADFVVVSRNLCVPIPSSVSFQHAAFTTVGAVAMQSVRIADIRLGENVVVIGLGLVGLIVAQILKAGGCRVFGVDIDPQRIKWVEENGLCPAVIRNADNIHDIILEFSKGYGADAVIITAAVESNDPVVLAGEITRYKGRVVVVGRTIMNAPRETYLFKELQLCTSYAYGPGADDPTYEIEGHDYPIGYVRWTENRNMESFLNLLSEGKININPLITHEFPVDKAPKAFDLITTSKELNIGVILGYEDDRSNKTLSVISHTASVSTATFQQDSLRVGIIGSGSFATNFMIPLLAKRKDITLRAIASSTGIKAAALAKKYGITRAVSEAGEIIEALDIDCVFIFTRHGTHATFSEKALVAGKHVFVEKPLALTEDELERVISAQKRSGNTLMVGFNRRFSPLAIKIKNFFFDRCQPMLIRYRGNVGYRPPEHWLHDPIDGGGVILGEACHYIDYCRWMIDSPITHVEAKSLGPSNTKFIAEDNVTINISFQDGSIAAISYVSNGAKGFGNERCEAHGDGRSAVWEDFKFVKLVKDLGFPKTYRNRIILKKGYREELDAFFNQVKQKSSSNIEWLPSQLDSSLASIRAARCVQPSDR
jgi:predicted dehydrogenase/threonine dehydrogenase-like Zn-dependent dehydrogenase